MRAVVDLMVVGAVFGGAVALNEQYILQAVRIARTLKPLLALVMEVLKA